MAIDRFRLLAVGGILAVATAACSDTAPVQRLSTQKEDGDATLSSTGCGTERWNVKTGADADRYKVPLKSFKQTTVAWLRSVKRPSGSLPSNNRISPIETGDWWVSVRLKQYKVEGDSDLHLVIADSNGRTMIVEIPSPTCVSSSSPMRSYISAARNAFNAKYHATTSWHYVNRSIHVRGAGFWDFLHGQTGVAPNGIELHPVLGISFQ